jgi:hypothetical protein
MTYKEPAPKGKSKLQRKYEGEELYKKALVKQQYHKLVE